MTGQAINNGTDTEKELQKHSDSTNIEYRKSGMNIHLSLVLHSRGFYLYVSYSVWGSPVQDLGRLRSRRYNRDIEVGVMNWSQRRRPFTPFITVGRV